MKRSLTRIAIRKPVNNVKGMPLGMVRKKKSKMPAIETASGKMTIIYWVNSFLIGKSESPATAPGSTFFNLVLPAR